MEKYNNRLGRKLRGHDRLKVITKENRKVKNPKGGKLAIVEVGSSPLVNTFLFMFVIFSGYFMEVNNND